MNIEVSGMLYPEADCPSIPFRSSGWGKFFILSDETTSFGRGSECGPAQLWSETIGFARNVHVFVIVLVHVLDRNVPDFFERGFRIEETPGNLGFSEMPFRARARLTSTITNHPIQGPIKTTFSGGRPVADG